MGDTEITEVTRLGDEPAGLDDPSDQPTLTQPLPHESAPETPAGE